MSFKKRKKSKTAVDIARLVARDNNNVHYNQELLRSLVAKDIIRFTECLRIRRIDLEYIHTDQDSCRIIDLASFVPGCEKFVNELILTGANINSVNPSTSKTPAHYAAESGNITTLKLLLNAGANPNVQDNIGDTLLHVIIKSRDQNRPFFAEALTLLLDNKDIAINVPNIQGHTPISLAAVAGDEETVGELLRIGSTIDLDTFRCQPDNKTAREIILENFPGLEEELPGLWEPNPGRGVLDYRYRLFYYLKTGQEIRFCQVLKETLNQSNENQCILLSCYDGHHYTYLQHSAASGYSKAVRLLLKSGADVNLAPLNTESPLHLAIRNGRSDIVPILMAEIDIDIRSDSNGESLIHKAVKAKGRSFGHYDVLRKLLKHPFMDVNAADTSGKTPLHYAVNNTCEKTIFLLLDHGARMDTPNAFGEMPLNQISSTTLRKYLDAKITTNDQISKHKEFSMQFDYKFVASSNNQDHIHGLKTDILSHLAESAELRSLLAHPIYATIILFKWHRIRMIFYLDLFFYTLFCVLLTCYHIFSPEIALMKTDCPTPSLIENMPANETEILMCQNRTHYVLAVQSFIILFSMTLAVSEIFQCLSMPNIYFKSLENWIQIAVVLSSVLSIVNATATEEVAAVSLFFAWFEFFFVIGKHPKLTFYLDMFRTASSFLLQFLAVHTSLILAFVFSFFILFRGESDQFKNVPDSLFKTLIMITGEFDVDDLPLHSSPITSHILFACFLFLVAIVLFNLLIGLAVSATKPIEDDAFLFSCISQVPIIAFFENIFFNNSQLLSRMIHMICRCFTKPPWNTKDSNPVLTVYPNQQNRMVIHFWADDREHEMGIKHHLTEKIVQDAQYIIAKKQDKDSTKCDKFDEIKQQVEATQIALEEEIRTLKSAMVEMLEKLEGYEADDIDGQTMRRRKAKSEIILRKLRSGFRNSKIPRRDI